MKRCKSNALNPLLALKKITTIGLTVIVGLVTAFSLSGCKKFNNNDILFSYSDKQLYSLGLDHFSKEQYDSAQKHFKAIFERYPLSYLVQKSEIAYAHSLYMAGKYDDAIDVYLNYLIYFPTSPLADYTKYMLFMAHYSQIRDIYRDQNHTESALEVFNNMKVTLPKDNIYYRDVLSKMPLIYDYLMARHMVTGIYYLEHGMPIAAIIKFKKSMYYPTVHLPELLYRITESYSMMGVDIQAAKYFGLLKHNYPNSPWYHQGTILFKNKRWYQSYQQYLNLPFDEKNLLLPKQLRNLDTAN